MKTLKKTLCLVLAVVMAVGVLILPANAAGYNDMIDKTEINDDYKVAVATLTGMGIISGKASGTDTKFDPKGTLLRQEAAIMIVNVMMKAEDKDANLAGYADKFDDISGADVYARREINYLAALGIVSGKGDGKFKPHDTLTTYELLTMLRQVAEKLGGYESGEAEWKAEAVKFANSYGVYSDTSLRTAVFAGDMDKAPTREQAAQIIWDVVKYSETAATNQFDIRIADGPIITVDAQTLALYQALFDNSSTVEFELIGAHQDISGSIGGLVYGLHEKANTTDNYGRPTLTYNNNKTGNDEEIYSSTPVGAILSDNDGITGKEVLAAFGKKDSETLQVVYVVDGVPETSPKTINKDTIIAARGTLVEGFIHNSTNYVIVTHTYCATTSEEVEIEVNSQKIKCWKLADNVYVPQADFAKNSIVVYTKGASVFADAKVADTAPGLVTRKSTGSTRYVYVDGFQKFFSEKYDTDENSLLVLDGETTLNFYYDNYGNIIHVAVPTSSAPATVAQYVYVLEYKEQKYNSGDTDLLGNSSHSQAAAAAARVLDPLTGTVSVVNLALAQKNGNYYLADAFGYANDNAGVVGESGHDTDRFHGLVTYTKIGEDYVLTPAVTGTNVYVGSKLSIDKGQAKVTFGDNNTVVYANAATSLVVVNYNNDNKPVTPDTKNGYTNFGDLDVTEVAGKVSIAIVEYKDSVATRIFAIVPPAAVSTTTSPSDKAIYVGKGDQTLDGTPYTFIIDGKEVTYYAANSTAIDAHDEGDFVKVVLTKGLLTSVSPATGVTVGTAAKVEMVQEGYIVVNGEVYYVNSSTVVYDADAAEGVGLGATIAKDNMITFFATENTTTHVKTLDIVVINAHKEA